MKTYSTFFVFVLAAILAMVAIVKYAVWKDCRNSNNAMSQCIQVIKGD